MRWHLVLESRVDLVVLAGRRRVVKWLAEVDQVLSLSQLHQLVVQAVEGWKLLTALQHLLSVAQQLGVL